MSKKIAFVFPGQGSQSVGMLSVLAAKHPIIQDTFAQASAILGYDLWHLSQNGPEETLNQTEMTQPILFCADVAIWRLWQQEKGPQPTLMTGHSLGEYAALACADAIDFVTGLHLVKERGRLMQEAVPEGKGAMLAVIGLDVEPLQALCQTVAQGQVLAPANYNAPGQIVVAGETEAIERLFLAAKQAGAKLVKRVAMSVPSHCELMKPAAQKLAHYLQGVTIHTPTLSVLNNVDIRVESKSERIKDALVRQLYHPIRWVELVQSCVAQGIELIVECGPAKVLAGLNKRITSIPTLSIQGPESFALALQESQ
ncbi:ACP S-malonyltransferase [Rickettsiella massiliensis]|uniref:ACP S-malonyltransferase n=1 Tax=Rickettsiella massiliensis TaxID=676517 RepID=UPI00029AE570|nr:ACP S-malonyltransferase [Rickettsiella massiliensis]